MIQQIGLIYVSDELIELHTTQYVGPRKYHNYVPTQFLNKLDKHAGLCKAPLNDDGLHVVDNLVSH